VEKVSWNPNIVEDLIKLAKIYHNERKARIRAYRPEDWEEVVRLFHDTVHFVNAADYTVDQLNAWVPEHMVLPELKKRLVNTYSVVAEKDGVIVGFGNVNGTGYFDCLYIHKNYQRMGVGTLIADEIEKYFCRNGIHMATTDASITAKPFFEKRGYIVEKEQKVACRGQLLTNFKMHKILDFYAPI